MPALELFSNPKWNRALREIERRIDVRGHAGQAVRSGPVGVSIAPRPAEPPAPRPPARVVVREINGQRLTVTEVRYQHSPPRPGTVAAWIFRPPDITAYPEVGRTASDYEDVIVPRARRTPAGDETVLGLRREADVWVVELPASAAPRAARMAIVRDVVTETSLLVEEVRLAEPAEPDTDPDDGDESGDETPGPLIQYEVIGEPELVLAWPNTGRVNWEALIEPTFTGQSRVIKLVKIGGVWFAEQTPRIDYAEASPVRRVVGCEE